MVPFGLVLGPLSGIVICVWPCDCTAGRGRSFLSNIICPLLPGCRGRRQARRFTMAATIVMKPTIDPITIPAISASVSDLVPGAGVGSGVGVKLMPGVANGGNCSVDATSLISVVEVGILPGHGTYQRWPYLGREKVLRTARSRHNR